MPDPSDHDDHDDRTVDLRGLLCPIPVIRTAEQVAAGRPGASARVSPITRLAATPNRLRLTGA